MQIIPSVIIPAGQPLVPQAVHFGAIMAEHTDVESSTIHVACGADIQSSITSYWVFEIGYWHAGGWVQLATASTKPAAYGGLGDMVAGTWYVVKHAPSSLEWGDTLSVKSTPIGNPPAPSFAVGLPGASLS
jgi:hypothetical protein